MQTVTSAEITNSIEGETTTLKDVRDNQDYTVAKINGNLWMTRNLAIGCNGTGSTYGSAVSSKPLTSDDSNVTNTSSSPWNTPTTSLTSGNSYDDPRMTCSSTYGAWYNYSATSAGTITDAFNNDTATHDICPKNWRLPTHSEFSGITSYRSAFSPVTGGLYRGGSNLYANSVTTREAGFYVRCIRSS